MLSNFPQIHNYYAPKITFFFCLLDFVLHPATQTPLFNFVNNACQILSCNNNNNAALVENV